MRVFAAALLFVDRGPPPRFAISADKPSNSDSAKLDASGGSFPQLQRPNVKGVARRTAHRRRWSLPPEISRLSSRSISKGLVEGLVSDASGKLVSDGRQVCRPWCRPKGGHQEPLELAFVPASSQVRSPCQSGVSSSCLGQSTSRSVSTASRSRCKLKRRGGAAGASLRWASPCGRRFFGGAGSQGPRNQGFCFSMPPARLTQPAIST